MIHSALSMPHVGVFQLRGGWLVVGRRSRYYRDGEDAVLMAAILPDALG